MSDPFHHFLSALWSATGGAPQSLGRVTLTGEGALPSAFPVTDLAAASIAAAGLAAADLMAARGAARPTVSVDRRLASLWFKGTVRPLGWQLPPAWDAVAGDYLCADGWIRLHTNAAHHRRAALAVLGTPADRAAVAQAVAKWSAGALEAAVVEAGGCAAEMRAAEAWAAHPQGRAVAAEPLLHHASFPAAARPDWPNAPARPLLGIRVLDLTRVLAGPTATRFLAGLGADVLRIDPPCWEEPSLLAEMTLGKRCARLDLTNAQGRAVFERLLGRADVLVHGYRSDALENLGLGADRRRALNPGLVDVGLDAYGWSGPWAARRGFDSLVQMSSGIAHAGMMSARADKPTPLPVQALDYAAGYLLAAAALSGLTRRLTTGEGTRARTSLARMAALLVSTPGDVPAAPAIEEAPGDWSDTPEATVWGPLQRLKPPLKIEGAPLRWDIPAGELGTSAAAW